MLFGKGISKQLKQEIDKYLWNYYAPERLYTACEDSAPPEPVKHAHRKSAAEKCGSTAPLYGAAMPAAPMPTAVPGELDDAVRNLDESFQEMLLRKINEKGMKDSECYKRAGIDRKLFSKIRSNPLYKPKKTTAIAFCMALELPYQEAKEMLRKAGYALSHSSKFDVIVEYFFINRRYSLYELNCALYAYDQPVIG